MPTTIGSIIRPASVGLAPCTICMYCGRIVIAPNIAAPTITLAADDHRGGAQPEDPQRDQGVVVHPVLGVDEPERAGQADDVAGDRPGGVPAPDAALLGHGEQRDQGDDQHRGAPPVDAGLAPDVVQVQVAGDHEQRGDADRHVDQEDPAPAGDPHDRLLAGEEAAGHRAQHARGGEDGHEVAGVLGALARGDDVADDREHQGEQAAGAETLHGAQCGEHVHRGGERACGRADDEHGDREQEQLLAAVEVAELAVDRRGDGRGDQVGRRHPRLDRQTVQVVGDGADRGTDDGLVERGEEHAQQQARQDRQDLLVGVLARLLTGGDRVALGSGRHPTTIVARRNQCESARVSSRAARTSRAASGRAL